MGDRVTSYFARLGALFAHVQVSDQRGRSIGLTEGIESAIHLVVHQTAQGRKVIFIGNGGSAAIASHQAVDYWKNGRMRAIAFNDASLLTCVSNDFGYQHVFEKPMEMFADVGDVLFAISSSGCSENILRGVTAATTKGCHVVTMSGFAPDNPLRQVGRLNFYVSSKSHGHVEIIHYSLCHCIVDCIVDEAKARGVDQPHIVNTSDDGEVGRAK